MILVVGATGLLGGKVTRRLLEQGRQVRILVRTGSDYQPLVDAGAQPVTGDLKDPDSLRRACEGVQQVVTTANSASRGGDDTVESVDLHGNLHLIDAAKTAGVEQFVFISGLGSDPASPVPFLSAKGRAEQHLRESGVPYTILVANTFMDIWFGLIIGMPLEAGGPITMIGEGARKHSFVAVEDVAAYTVAVIGDPQSLNQTYYIGGPQAVSWMDVIAAVEAQLGRKLDVRHIPMGEPLPNMPPTVTGLLTSMNTYDSPMDMTPLQQRFGVQPTPLQAFIPQMFPAQSA